MATSNRPNPESGNKRKEAYSRQSLRLVLATAMLLAGCRQSYKDGMRVICEAERECCSRDYPNPADRAIDMSMWIDERLKNREAQDVARHVADLPPDKKGRALLEAARKAGISDADCPTAFR